MIDIAHRGFYTISNDLFTGGSHGTRVFVERDRTKRSASY